jgi:4-amino-4-deoxy-L-arabinose transferase-like glycosyltransferase
MCDSLVGSAGAAGPRPSSPLVIMRNQILFILLFVLAAAGRLLYIIHFRTYLTVGAGGEMEHAAVTLAQRGFIGDAFGPGTGPTAHLVPLYPMLLAGIYRVFGWNTLEARLIQELLAIAATSAGIAILPFVARKARLPLTAGILAAALLAVLPIHLWVETSGNWEQPYAALALLGLFWCFLSLHEARWQSWRAAALVGAFLGAAALLSASMVAVGACLFAASLWSAPGARKRVLTRGLLLASISALVISPWAIRNYRELGGFIPLRSNFGLELAVGNNDKANGIGYDPSWEGPAGADFPAHPFRNIEELTQLRSMGERAYMEAKQREGITWIRTHPGRFAALTAHRFVLFWFPTPDLWTAPTPLRGFKAAISAAISAGALLGLAALFASRHPSRWFLLAALFGASAVYFILHVGVRYRYPVIGLSTLLAAYALLRAVEWIRARRTWA